MLIILYVLNYKSFNNKFEMALNNHLKFSSALITVGQDSRFQLDEGF